jgi:CubicO group peptidase (beta-lactamase class C family)
MAVLLRGTVLTALLLGSLAAGPVAVGGEAGAGARGSWTPSVPVDPERLDDFVAGQMDRADIPGVAYAVVDPGGVVHQGTFGQDGDGRAVTAATPFLWGSVAKPVTASLVVKLADAGVLALDAPVTTYLPGFSMADEEARTITVRHLLNQTSGIANRMDLTDHYEEDRHHGDVVEELSGTHLAADVGEEHVYSSVNYMLLGAVVEAATGRGFARALRDRLLEPAGMDSVITEADDAAVRLPPGHRYVLGLARSFRTGFDPAGVSSGYLGGSLEDAVAFARANLEGSTVLSARQRARLVHPEVSTGDGRSYGLGWRTWPVFGSDQPMIWHAGAAPGYQAGIVILPEQDRAVVVLQNVYGSFQEPRLLDTAWGLASMLSGAEPETHEADPLYVVSLGVLGIVCLGLSAGVAIALRRTVRPIARGRRRAAVGLAGWLVVTLAVTGALLAVPAAFGVTLGQVPLWAPDVAALLDAGLVLAGMLAVTRVAVAVRSTRGRRTGRTDVATAPPTDRSAADYPAR